MYLITNEGLNVLEKSGLKKILDFSFKELEDDMLVGVLYDDEIEEYAQEHNIYDLLEKVEADNIFDKSESFIMHSEIICDLLKNKLPKNLEKEIKNAVSAYYIYCNKFLKRVGYRGSYLWRDKKFLNSISGDTHGDMIIAQYDITPNQQLDLFGYKELVKKTDYPKLVNGFYPEWIRTLTDFITFCIQINKPVPFRENWEKEFYNGQFKENKPGEVASFLIEQLKDAKEYKKYSHIEVLPFVDNPKKHINPDKNIFHISPIESSMEYLSYPFIDGESLVYLHKKDTGIEFLREYWGNPGVRFDYKQIPNAIKGVVSCIQNMGSRCHYQDPGLVFKYFPYERYNFIT